MSNIWFISDTHFQHANVIKYSSRPFKDADEMDQYMIDKWNSVVSPEDTIYHLGDFALTSRGKMGEIMTQLNGEKILKLGNHDRAGVSFFLRLGFKEVFKKRSIIFDDTFILSHAPLTDEERGSRWNISGHTHNNTPFIQGRTINVSVEQIDYTPIDLEYIRELVKKFE